ncbi:hypothetical protein [Marinobacterium sp. BA1]|uniref:hypothetical protein n=1 Tax=Marinobacterium sp. BA1 TaxID=3138931 RepID=UPI0032E593E8
MTSESNDTIQFYHGGRDWVGPFEVSPKNSKVMEYGPGLYLTNGIETARHYARGGGIVQTVDVDPNARLLSGVKSGVGHMEQFIAANRVRSGKKVIANLHRNAERHGSDRIGLDYLITLMINHNALTPSVAAPLNEFIVGEGADLDVFSAPMFGSAGGGSDQWVVVFNPEVVVARARVDMKAFDWSRTHLPTYEEQMAALALNNEVDPLGTAVCAEQYAGKRPSL